MSDKDLGTLLRAKEILNGYFLPRPFESAEKALNRAKNEAIQNLQKQIVDIRNLTSEEFYTSSEKEIDDAC
ncbi:hypothetical protein KUL113_04040 [Tenacibaculum sp. KUL113]|nr:hypothetical protein KUL113_04040 [Tenacibaculum sp. KUL113]